MAATTLTFNLRLWTLAFVTFAVIGCCQGGKVKRSDDGDPLDAVVSVLSGKINTLETELSALKASVGANTAHLGKTVAFTVFFTATDVTLSPKGTLRFDNEETNIGNGYNKNSGIFTAPYSGTYAFIFNVMVWDNQSIQVAITKGDTIIALTHADANNDVWDKGMTHAVVHLDAGDEVWVRHEQHDTHIYGARWTSFSGFLLHADD